MKDVFNILDWIIISYLLDFEQSPRVVPGMIPADPDEEAAVLQYLEENNYGDFSCPVVKNHDLIPFVVL